MAIKVPKAAGRKPVLGISCALCRSEITTARVIYEKPAFGSPDNPQTRFASHCNCSGHYGQTIGHNAKGAINRLCVKYERFIKWAVETGNHLASPHHK